MAAMMQTAPITDAPTAASESPVGARSLVRTPVTTNAALSRNPLTVKTGAVKDRTFARVSSIIVIACSTEVRGPGGRPSRAGRAGADARFVDAPDGATGGGPEASAATAEGLDVHVDLTTGCLHLRNHIEHTPVVSDGDLGEARAGQDQFALT